MRLKFATQVCDMLQRYYTIWMKPSNAPKGQEMITPRFSINRNKQLGRGCYGVVYEGYDHTQDQVIAIKHLTKPENFMDEVSTLQKLSTLVHPNIMGFYGYKADDKDVYFFVENCPGGVLTDLINKGLEEEQVLDLFRQLVEGMCYMNAKCKMHRDLKPDNILLGKNKDIKISDFGLSRENDGIDVTGTVGTPLYAGPEVYTNYLDSYQDNCDVWGAGLILHEMLTGKLPFGQINTMTDLKNEWKKFERGEKRVEYPKDFHPQWQFLTNLMLTHNHKKRPTFHQVLEILKKIDDHGPMRKEIRNKKSGKDPANMNPAQAFLLYTEKKLDFLVDLESDITGERYPHLPQAIKKLIIFLTSARYYRKLQKLIRSLKFKTITYPNEKEMLDRSSPDSQVALIMENYRLKFESKMTKCKNDIEEKIIPDIDKFASTPEGKKYYASVDSAYKLVVEVKEGSYDIEDAYEEEYVKLLGFHKVKPTDDRVKEMSAVDQEAYLHILMVGFLSSEFPDTEFMKKDFIGNKLNKLSREHPEEMQRAIFRLRGFLK